MLNLKLFSNFLSFFLLLSNDDFCMLFLFFFFFPSLSLPLPSLFPLTLENTNVGHNIISHLLYKQKVATYGKIFTDETDC